MPIEIPILESRILADNPLRDPANRRLVVYLPPGYAEERQRRYPVAFLLAGFSGRGTSFLNESAWDENIEQRLDRLHERRLIEPMIVVMPDCMTRFGGSQYINSAATGRYEDHLIEEVVPFVDRRYRTRCEPGQRAVAGKSSGGYGATVLGMRHPDVFGAVADHSGDKYFELCYKSDIPRCLSGLARYASSPREFLHRFPHPRPERGPHWFATANLLAMASCYSPNPESDTGFDLPFDPYTGELRNDVWQRWLAHDPIELVGRHAASLRKLALYYLDCGRRDEHHLQYGARVYCERLAAHEIPHRYEEFDGGHSGTAHRYDVSLRALSEVFK